MTSGYHVQPENLGAQVTDLAQIGDRTKHLAESASRLAERLPMLGTAPPAIHLAMRLRAAAGESGHYGEVSAADRGVHSYHRALKETVSRYLDAESDHRHALRNAAGDDT